MRSLVLGSAGQLGHEIARLVGADTGLTRGQLSITDAAAVDEVIAARRPDVVFNCAAYNAVDRAESEPDVARAVNSDGPRNIALACARHGAHFVHFSTNFVFDGEGAEPYVESDVPRPLSVYAASKLAGEQEALLQGTHVLVIRTAAVFGRTTGRSFPERIVERARSGGRLRVVSDQTVNPTYAPDLAAAAVELAENGYAGIVHAVGDGCATWYEFARTAMSEAQVAADIEPVSSAAYPTPARRPVNGCLATIRFHALRAWQEAVADWAKNP